MNILNIKIGSIIPDENQPRKYFDESKMATLRASIKAHGIKNPLTLEIQKNGTYLIIDGERRFRAAKQLGLKEIPALLQPVTNDVQRLIEQFHIQEQHEGWSTTEKAVAVVKLCDAMNTTIEEVGRLLAIPETQLRSYIAFGHLVDKKNFQKNRISMRYAGSINNLNAYIKKISTENHLEFDRNTAKSIENAIYDRVGNGEELNMQFFNKFRDAIKQNPKYIKEFIENDSLTVDKMFFQSKANGAMYLRKIGSNASWLVHSIENFMKDKSSKVDISTLNHVKRALKKSGEFVKAFEE